MEGSYTSYRKRLLAFIILAVFLIGIIILSYTYGPEELVEMIGVKNGYIIAIIVSFFGGFSAFTSFSYYGVLITLISGGLNPVLLGLVSGLSISTGDTLMFYFGRKGRDIVKGKLDVRINSLARYMKEKKLIRFVPYLAYIYLSVLPLPNDWLLLFLASIKYPSRKMIPLIIAGDLTFTLLLCLLTSKGIIMIS